MEEILVFCLDVARAAAARRRLVRELEGLSDRMLADIGLDRQDVRAHVDSGRPRPPSPFRPRARLRPSLKGCG